MAQPPIPGWHPPDQPGPHAGNGQYPRPVPPTQWQAPYPPGPPVQPGPPHPHHRYPTPPHPVPRPPYAGPPLPPPSVPGAPPRPWPPPPPRRVVPPVPVTTPRDEDRYQPPPIQLPPAPGDQGKLPRLPTAKRIPSDLPFVVNPRATVWYLLYLIPLLVLLAPAGYLLATGHVAWGLIALVLTIAAYICAFGFRLVVLAWSGPLLAADRDHLWVQARKWPVLAVRIPWELVAEIRVRRWFLEKVVCVIPRDPRIGRMDGMWSSIDQARTSAFFHSRLTASTRFGDKSAETTLAVLADLAAGRARVVGAPRPEPRPEPDPNP